MFSCANGLRNGERNHQSCNWKWFTVPVFHGHIFGIETIWRLRAESIGTPSSFGSTKGFGARVIVAARVRLNYEALRGWRRHHDKDGVAHRSAADGVVAHDATFRMPFWLHSVAAPRLRNKLTRTFNCTPIGHGHRRSESRPRPRVVALCIEFGAEIDPIDDEYCSTPLGWARAQRPGRTN